METSCLLVVSEHEALPIAPLILTFSFLLLHKHLHFARGSKGQVGITGASAHVGPAHTSQALLQ